MTPNGGIVSIEGSDVVLLLQHGGYCSTFAYQVTAGLVQQIPYRFAEIGLIDHFCLMPMLGFKKYHDSQSSLLLPDL